MASSRKCLLEEEIEENLLEEYTDSDQSISSDDDDSSGTDDVTVGEVIVFLIYFRFSRVVYLLQV